MGDVGRRLAHRVAVVGWFAWVEIVVDAVSFRPLELLHEEIAVQRDFEQVAHTRHLRGAPHHFVHMHVVGVPVVAVPVVADEHQTVGLALLFAHDGGEPPRSVVDVRTNEGTGLVVLRPARHTAVFVPQPLVPSDAENRHHPREFFATSREQTRWRVDVGRALAVAAVGGGHQHHTVAGRGVLRDGAATDQTLVVRVRVQEDDGGHAVLMPASPRRRR